ncbi:hypothetical protein P692DRAFT_201851876 [Suillus brevipes Sb2]|nr:hypothetical protein P692DRAFT_201851876 [Suillus brevipes Sb2]
MAAGKRLRVAYGNVLPGVRLAARRLSKEDLSTVAYHNQLELEHKAVLRLSKIVEADFQTQWLTLIIEGRKLAGRVRVTAICSATVTLESGAIYATGVLSILLAYLSGSKGQYTVLDAVSPIMGIVFCLTILQVHFQIGSKSHIARTLEPRGVNTGSSESQLYAMWAGA